MRKINKEETRKLLERAIRRWFSTYNEVVVYDPIYEDETVDEKLISLKMEEISGGTIVIDPIFYGKPYDGASILTDDIEGLPIQYDFKVYSNYERLINHLLEEAEEREFKKLIDELEDKISNVVCKFQKENDIEIQIKQDEETLYNEDFWAIKVLVKNNIKGE